MVHGWCIFLCYLFASIHLIFVQIFVHRTCSGDLVVPFLLLYSMPGTSRSPSFSSLYLLYMPYMADVVEIEGSGRYMTLPSSFFYRCIFFFVHGARRCPCSHIRRRVRYSRAYRSFLVHFCSWIQIFMDLHHLLRVIYFSIYLDRHLFQCFSFLPSKLFIFFNIFYNLPVHLFKEGRKVHIPLPSTTHGGWSAVPCGFDASGFLVGSHRPSTGILRACWYTIGRSARWATRTARARARGASNVHLHQRTATLGR